MNCKFIGLHFEEREATQRAGWICEEGHVSVLEYCDECFAWLEKYQVSRTLECSPPGIYREQCYARTKLLEAVRV